MVVTQVLEDAEAEGSRYRLRELFVADAFYDTLEDVVKDYRRQTGAEAK